MNLSIARAAHRTGLSPDTIRYYEKIGVLPRVLRDNGGRRSFQDSDIDRLRFIVRAKKMQFSLADIARLLALRDHGSKARRDARRLAAEKLDEINQRLEELRLLRNELQLLINLCDNAEGDRCPIVEGLGEQP